MKKYIIEVPKQNFEIEAISLVDAVEILMEKIDFDYEEVDLNPPSKEEYLADFYEDEWK